MESTGSYREYPPCSALDEYIECYWSREARVGGESPTTQRVLPDGCVDILFDLSAGDPAGS